MPLLLTKPLCAIDGEGKSNDEGLHHYTLLAASWPTGKRRIEGANLGTYQCLRFIADLPADHTYVIFGGSYDTSMILKDLPRCSAECGKCGKHALDRLFRTGRTWWLGFKIAMIPRKKLTVTYKGKTVTLYDVLAFWQKSFVQCLKDWNIGTPEEVALIADMKAKRGTFSEERDEDIERYCYLECDLLRQLVQALREAILETPYRPKALYGPGALAASVLEHEGFKHHLAELPEEVEDVAGRAYFGGRFDTARLGWYKDVHGYDIRSAYPDQIRYLPCLAHAHFEKVPELRAGYGVYHVRWKVPASTPYPPFPFRAKDNTVSYPCQGEGWYHAEEVRAGIMVFGAERIEVLEGYQLVQECEHTPLKFVERLYDWRTTLPYEQGIVVKLAINSLYGKLAQSVGFKGRKPPFQCFYLAGAITAGTRAKLLQAIYQRPEAIISVATDGIVSEKELNLPIGKQLGEWEYKFLREHAQISNGVYHSVDENGKDIERARGIGRAELNWSEIKEAFDTEPLGGIAYTRRRFIGLKEGSIRTDGRLCVWVDEPRKLSFYPTRRHPDIRSERHGDYPRMNLQAFELPLDGSSISQPYKKAQSWAEVEQRHDTFHPQEAYLYDEQ